MFRPARGLRLLHGWSATGELACQDDLPACAPGRFPPVGSRQTWRAWRAAFVLAWAQRRLAALTTRRTPEACRVAQAAATARLGNRGPCAGGPTLRPAQRAAQQGVAARPTNSSLRGDADVCSCCAEPGPFRESAPAAPPVRGTHLTRNKPRSSRRRAHNFKCCRQAAQTASGESALGRRARRACRQVQQHGRPEQLEGPGSCAGA